MLNDIRIVIKGLNGHKTVEFNFDKKCEIFLGINGSGKTTALRILNLLLAGSTADLMKEKFSEIILWKEGIIVERIEKRLHGYESFFEFQQFIDKYFSIKTMDFSEGYKINKDIENGFKNIIKHWAKIIPDEKYDIEVGATKKKDLIDKQKELENIRSIHNRIRYEFGNSVVYLPTFRRIEADFIRDDKLRSIDDEKYDMNLSMKDVDKQIEAVLTQIRNSSSDSFSSLAGNLLTECVMREAPRDRVSEYDPKVVELALNRIGAQIQPEVREKILDIIKGRQYLDAKYLTLFDILDNLLLAYKQQQDLDEKLRAFETICNKYLYGKKAVYDESKVEFGFHINSSIGTNIVIGDRRQRNRLNKEIELSQLSSGEKQIVSIFSRLYLGDMKDIILIIDEPELSLSIEWQRNIMADIIASRKCSYIAAATHSPFIFVDESIRPFVVNF